MTTWHHHPDYHLPCQELSREHLWGLATVQVWIPAIERVERIAADRLLPLTPENNTSSAHLCYSAAAARIVDALGQDTLVAPLEGTVIPLPHQLYALQRAMADENVRYLLADEVGLGKTIEAGLILRELKVRGLIRRILVVAPAGLVTQWVSELKTHFHEDFKLVLPAQFSAWRQITGLDQRDNLWRLHDQVVCPLDAVKPMATRRGWSREQVARHNRERFEDLVAAGWDLVIIDEAHRMGGSTEQVARYKLGQALAQATPYLLLLSATPHQGKTEGFRRLVGFLDKDALPDDDSVRRENVAPFVIRTEKRHAIDAEGNKLFKARQTQLVPVSWDDSLSEQRALYEAVTEYVREGYNRARREKKTAVGFLMILFQRLVTSSTAAIRTTLERRLNVLSQPPDQLDLFGDSLEEEWFELDGQEQLEAALASRMKGLRNERAEVELLLSTARRCEARGPDGKALELLEQIQGLQREETAPDLKILIFTEFVPTQTMLAAFLEQRGYSVVCLNGSLDLEERKAVQRAFSDDTQILISTDAGGEGLNLQFCHVVVNYDLPWNPMKLEQRIGRVDRIGQPHVVRALNFALEDTVELRVREVLEEKLQRILEEFGVDKLSDVLDSEESGAEFERLYVDAVLSPQDAELRAGALAEAVRDRAAAAQSGAGLMGTGADLDPGLAQQVTNHQLPFWTERVTLAWLETQKRHGASVERKGELYSLQWPDGTKVQRATFERPDGSVSRAEQLTLEDPRVREPLKSLAGVTPGQFVPQFQLPGISDKVCGWWSLWRIGLETRTSSEYRMLPIFISDDGISLAPTARVIWDKVISMPIGLPSPLAPLSWDQVEEAGQKLSQAAVGQGRALYEALVSKHQARLNRARERGGAAFEARRRAIERIGLPQVRAYRLAHLEAEEAEWRRVTEEDAAALPELTLMILLRVNREGGAQ